MKRGRLVSIIIFVGVTLVLLPNFYRNHWRAVEPETYTEWQVRYDRLVLARLVKTRQDGFLSAGGLMGLGDTERWAFDTKINRDQFDTYLNQGKFQSYLAYKSNPGFQGFMYGVFDKVSPFTGELNLKLLRGFTALSSAMVIGLILTAITLEFGILSGLLTLVFTVFSMWIVLPAGSIFWNLWASYLPFVVSATLLAEAARKNEYSSTRIHLLLFLAVLVKVLFSGFDITTTILIMATVPFVFYGLYHKWDRKTLMVRMIKAGIVLIAAAVTGLIILSLQIIANEGALTSAYDYILNRVGSHVAGNYEYFTNEAVEVRRIGVLEVLPKYMVMPAMDIQFQNLSFQVLYWHLIILFAIFTLIYILANGVQIQKWERPQKGKALMAATWYSLLAPLSWYILFKPHSFIHTHVNTMAWQMPFTLLGFALCGYVISDVFIRRRKTSVNEPVSPSSQTGLPLQSDTCTLHPRA